MTEEQRAVVAFQVHEAVWLIHNGGAATASRLGLGRGADWLGRARAALSRCVAGLSGR